MQTLHRMLVRLMAMRNPRQRCAEVDDRRLPTRHDDPLVYCLLLDRLAAGHERLEAAQLLVKPPLAVCGNEIGVEYLVAHELGRGEAVEEDDGCFEGEEG